jgi:WD40 repeat protein
MVPSPNGTRFIIDNFLQWSLADANYRIIKRIDMGVMGSMRSSIRFKFSADGSIFLCVVLSLFDDDKSAMRVFDSVTGEQRAQFSGLKKLHSFVASADGAWIACGHGSGKVDVFGVAGGQMSMDVSDDSPINVLVFSDDSRELMGGSNTGVVRVWDRASKACKATFGVSASMVTALAYAGTPGGATVAIGREDGSLCLWSPSTSASHDILHGDQTTVKNVDFVQFSHDRSRLTSRGEDGTVFTWAITFDADDADLARCALCPREEGSGGVSNPTTLPHLLSQSDPEDAVDSLFQTAYRVRKDGWLVKGDRRVIWFSPRTRPRGKDTFYAYENGQVVFFTPSRSLIFLKWVDK